ncbi:hypothetical protein H6758_03765 [Candidatus Nomurabacteria bacterium]|nr:hypothetical protein [Candidatus Nomurabacteria bacterium]
MKPLKSRNAQPDEFLCFVCERVDSARVFLDLLKKMIHVCQGDQDLLLRKAIEENLHDERGVGKGKSASHDKWREDYLEGIQKLHHERVCCCDHTCHFVYKQVFRDAVMRGDKGEMLGVLLYLERVIPIEFAFIRSYQDKVFCGIFVYSQIDTHQQRAIKRKLRRYLDDHIVHDAVDHYPKLLQAIQLSGSDLSMQEKIAYGAKIIHRAKLLSYETHFRKRKTGV